MCRNITALRGLEPPATREEIDAAALQYVRKVAGLSAVSPSVAPAVERAAAAVADATVALIEELPPRRRPPSSVPPLRRPEVRARLGRP